ncbi:hypothetical protein F4803DRAFT_550444 [Xylaria telfairii]|nr:hypothetical protein F4803DRAFT_550444 [Xylaria telfairii]
MAFKMGKTRVRRVVDNGKGLGGYGVGGAKKGSLVAKPIDSVAICRRLKDIVSSGDNSEKKASEILDDPEYREAFLEAKDADPNSGKRRGGKGNIFHHLVHGTSGWKVEDLTEVLNWLFDDTNQAHSPDAKPLKSPRRPFHDLLADELGDMTALHMALDDTNQNADFVNAMIRELKPPPKKLARVLCMPLKLKLEDETEPSTGQTCLHHAIRQGSPYALSIFDHMEGFMQEHGEKYWNPLRIQEPTQGNTPLHQAVATAYVDGTSRLISLIARIGNSPKSTDYYNLDLDLIESLVDSYQEALQIKNKSGRTPYQERLYTLQNNKFVKEAVLMFSEASSRAHKPNEAEGGATEGGITEGEVIEDDDGDLQDTIREVIETTRALITKPKTTRRTKGVTGSQAHNPVASVNGTSRTFQSEQVRSIEQTRREAGLIIRKVRKSLQDDPKQELPSDNFRAIVIEDPIAEVLRNYCIRHLEREAVMDCLYPAGQELDIGFNLLGISRQVISNEFLNGLAAYNRFEAALNHVVLPRLTFRIEEPRAAQSAVRGSKLPPNRRGRTDLVHIFDWLRAQNVRKIMKVTVFDDEVPCHTDSAIVKCLQGFCVEKWNWIKLDISSEVMWKSTIDGPSSSLSEISLHCSGSQAVLKGWSAEGGFGTWNKFRNLNRIELSLREGQEDDDTLEEYGQEFKHDIDCRVSQANAAKNADVVTVADAELSCGNEDPWAIHVTSGIDRFPYGLLTTGGARSSDKSGHPRITTLKNFTTFLRNNGNENSPSIKIAILDDGLDPTFEMLGTSFARIEGGLTFFSPDRVLSPDSSGMSPNHYVPFGDHGAQVASLICSICPNTTLYIAKLDQETTRDGVRQMNAQAAAKAVRWAINCNVDIINMSWTIEGHSESDEPEPLKAAVKEARDLIIVMFCSASDQGGNSKALCYPRMWHDTCIGIGALSVMDTPSVMLESQQVDFMFPGENIMVQNNDGTVLEGSGSSFATAIATGLGGLLMYCSVILGMGKTPSDRRAPARQSAPAKFLWDRKTMFNSFKKFSHSYRGRGNGQIARPESMINHLIKLFPYKKPLAEQDLDEDTMALFSEEFAKLMIEEYTEPWNFK